MLLKNKTEIENWLKKYNIKNYELIPDEKYVYVVNVHDHVDLSYFNLKNIDVKFNKINGGFTCGNNYLESLQGCPEILEGFFCCHNNQLKTLDFMPKIINNYFYCSHNLLTIKGLNKLFDVDFNNSMIHLDGNLELGSLQNVKNLNEIKKFLKIYQEKESINLLLSNKNNDFIKIMEKIKRL